MGFWQFYMKPDTRCFTLPTQVSRVCKRFQKSVKLENIICSSNAQPGSLTHNHEKNGHECVFCERKILKAFKIVIKTQRGS